jgi:hypothetical protein
MVRFVAGILFVSALAASPVYAIDPPATPFNADEYFGIDGSLLSLQPPLNSVDNYAPGDDYVILFAEVVDPTTNATGFDYSELPYNPFSLPAVDFTNSAGDSLSLHNASYFLSPTEIPLDNLNLGGLPSNFTPIPGIPDGTTIESGGSTPLEVLPEPSTCGLIALAGAFLTCAVHNRSRRAVQSAA